MKKKRTVSHGDREKTIFNIKNSFFLLAFFLALQANVFAQDQQAIHLKKISFEVRNQSLSVALNKIEELSDYKVIFNYEDVNQYKLSLTVKNKTVKEALDAIMASISNKPFTYSIEKEFITIAKKKETVTNLRDGVGRVTDSSNEPLAGVNIRLKNTMIGTSSDVNGIFKVAIPKEIKDPILIFSFVGMDTREIPYVGKYLDVVLNDGAVLSEVVVTGIFNKARESYTGAATTITVKELREAGHRDVLSSIRNVDPSFRIADNVRLGSDPNNMPTITMRGNSSLPTGINDLQADSRSMREANQPLFIMNGFEISLERVMDMDENQIESITLLKDANSTAMYGTRGSNGVVVITTRQPEPGRLQITYNGSINIEAPDFTSYNIMNAREKLQYEEAAGLYSAKNGIQEQELIELYNKRKLDMERGVDTYWLKYPVRTGVGLRHSLTLEGGDQSFRYSGAIAYNNIEGVMKGSQRNIFNGNLFFSYKLKNLIFQNNLQIVSTKSKNSPYGSLGTYSSINPYWTPYDDEGNLTKLLENYVYNSLSGPTDSRTSKVYNPLYNAFLPSKDQSQYQQIINDFSVEWHLLPELFLRGRFSVTSENSRSDVYLSANHTSFDSYTEADFDRKGKYTYGTGNMSKYDGDITLNYAKTFNKLHVLSVGIGSNFAESRSETYKVVGEGISVLNMDFFGMSSKYEQDSRPSGTESITRRVGGLLSTDYIYDRRYFADFSGKLEGSSQFGSESRYAPFWSTGIGWNLYNEPFMKDNKFVDIARFRLSYGVTGSQAFSPYQALTTYKDNGGKSYKTWYGVSMMALGNSDLGWQKTNQYNLGTEWTLFQNRFRFSIDLYDKITDNLLTDITLPTSSGFNSYRANVGKVQNRGFELTTNIITVQNKKSGFTWSVGGTMVRNKNTIKEISNSLQFLNEELSKVSSVNPSLMYTEGESMNTLYAVRSKGIDPSNGKEIYIKKDGTETYTWDSKDQVACGVAEPEVFGNLNTSVRYKGFILAVFFGYTYGGQVYNSTLANKVENNSLYNNADRRVLYDRWKNPGDVVNFKSVKDLSKTYATTRFVMDENTFTGQSLSLGYNVPSAWSKKHLNCQFLSLKAQMEDVFYISTVKRERSLDFPFSRKFSMSLTARF